MLYQVIAKVEGDTVARKPYELFVSPYIVKINCDDKHYVNKIIIQRTVDDYEQYLPQLTMDTDKGHSKIMYPSEPFYDDIINLLQHIESLGGFWFSIKKIYWENANFDWIPQDETERRKLVVFGLKYEQSYDKTPTELTPNLLRQVIEKRDLYKHLVKPLAFYREGVAEYERFRYANAFVNFYYFLEDLYGEGNTRNYKVENSFKKSIHLKTAIERAISHFNSPICIRHFEKIQQDYTKEKCNFDHEGIIKFIVVMRGNLHHYSQKSTKIKGHPFNQREFESMAYLIMTICIYTYVQLTNGEHPK